MVPAMKLLLDFFKIKNAQINIVPLYINFFNFDNAKTFSKHSFKEHIFNGYILYSPFDKFWQ